MGAFNKMDCTPTCATGQYPLIFPQFFGTDVAMRTSHFGGKDKLVVRA